MAQHGRSARESQEELEAYRNRLARRGSRLTMPQVRTLGWILLGVVSGVIITVVTLLLLPDGPKEWVADIAGMPVQEIVENEVPVEKVVEVIVEKEVPVESVVQVVVTATPGATQTPTDSALTQTLRQAPIPLGSLFVEGIYCWHRDSDDTERLRFAVYNPTRA